jgi:hypothetical protein
MRFTQTCLVLITSLTAKALFNNTADDDAAVGWHSMIANTSGTTNVAVGGLSLISNLTGDQNVAVGYQSMQ